MNTTETATLNNFEVRKLTDKNLQEYFMIINNDNRTNNAAFINHFSLLKKLAGPGRRWIGSRGFRHRVPRARRGSVLPAQEPARLQGRRRCAQPQCAVHHLQRSSGVELLPFTWLGASP